MNAIPSGWLQDLGALRVVAGTGAEADAWALELANGSWVLQTDDGAPARAVPASSLRFRDPCMLTMRIDLPPISKARPRAVIRQRKGTAGKPALGRKDFVAGTYTDADYDSWKASAALIVGAQARQAGHRKPIERVARLHVEHYGAKAVGDGDNMDGAVWDALVQGGVLHNDNVNAIPRWSGTWFRVPVGQKPHVRVYIRLLMPV